MANRATGYSDYFKKNSSGVSDSLDPEDDDQEKDNRTGAIRKFPPADKNVGDDAAAARKKALQKRLMKSRAGKV